MKKIKHISLFILSLLVFSSCEKMGENDGVRGFWRLVTVQNGSTETDVAADNIFWGMQDGIISIRSYNTPFAQAPDGEPCYELVGRYHINTDKLLIDAIYEHYDSHDETIIIFSEAMEKNGIKDSNPTFTIHKYKDKLILESQETHLELIKL